ncbi:hypothetical protein LINGRAHAP2_LOCUS26264 [Linum grandiflorum]
MPAGRSRHCDSLHDDTQRNPKNVRGLQRGTVSATESSNSVPGEGRVDAQGVQGRAVASVGREDDAAEAIREGEVHRRSRGSFGFE